MQVGRGEITRQTGGFASNSKTSVSGAPSKDPFASVPLRKNPVRPRGVSFQNSDILTDLLDLTWPDPNEWFVLAHEFIEVLYQIVDCVPKWLIESPADKPAYTALYVTLNSMSPVHIPTKYFFKINVNIKFIFSLYSQHYKCQQFKRPSHWQLCVKVCCIQSTCPDHTLKKLSQAKSNLTRSCAGRKTLSSCGCTNGLWTYLYIIQRRFE